MNAPLSSIASAELLVARIHHVNGGWHALRELWPPAEGTNVVIAGMRDLKALLQVQLLRDPGSPAFLVEDLESALLEPCYSVQLRDRSQGYSNACHLPIRVARELLTERELAELVAAGS